METPPIVTEVDDDAVAAAVAAADAARAIAYVENETNPKTFLKSLCREVLRDKPDYDTQAHKLEEFAFQMEAASMRNKGDADGQAEYMYRYLLGGGYVDRRSFVGVPSRYRPNDLSNGLLSPQVRAALKDLRKLYLVELRQLRRKHRDICARIESAMKDAVDMREEHMPKDFGALKRRCDAMDERHYQMEQDVRDEKQHIEDEARAILDEAQRKTTEAFSKRAKLE